MQEYFEGTRIIQNDDGSTTYITYEHEPYSEPLTTKQKAAMTVITLGALGTVIGLPVIVDKFDSWSFNRKAKRERQKLNKEIFDTMKKS